jgi:GT2 family glycosyltransferase
VPPTGRIDVIIPVFNQYELVKGCIESVLNSNNRTLFELVVVDDCSTEKKVVNYLRDLQARQQISLFVNDTNLGFTKTVNFAMQLHTDRDVLLLNSDTCVNADWLDRLVNAAYSSDKVATVIPLSNASHISGYPLRSQNFSGPLEVDDKTLDQMAAENSGQYAPVHATVGFCMFIKRNCLREIGYFDANHFPIGYGEETDFCYRARKVGWKHLVAGDVFVRHFEGRSFGPRKQQLMRIMLEKFSQLHPEGRDMDQWFAKTDPVSSLRCQLDLSRVKRLMAGRQNVSVYIHHPPRSWKKNQDTVCAVYDPQNSVLRYCVQSSFPFPNLPEFRLPTDIHLLNQINTQLGIQRMVCISKSDMQMLKSGMAGLIFETQLQAVLESGSLDAVQT